MFRVLSPASSVLMYRVLFLGSVLTTVSSVQPNIEDKFDSDTRKCKDLARANHPEDPSASLDHFLLCLTSHLEQLPDDDGGELEGLKTTLREVEENQLFFDKNTNHIVKRDTDQARGWKKNKRSKKKKDKRKKDKIKEFLEDLDEFELSEEDNLSDEHAEDVEVAEDEEEETDKEKNPFTNGLQFSAYSSQGRPQYSPPSRQESYQQKFMYGMDLDGNPQFIDKAAVSMLLQNPQAKKAMMDFLSNEQAENIEMDSVDHFPYRRPASPPSKSRPQLASVFPPILSTEPKMEFFGPKDYVPEVGHLVGGEGYLQLHQTPVHQSSPVVPHRKQYLKLEPKPRRRRDVEDEDAGGIEGSRVRNLQSKTRGARLKKNKVKKESGSHVGTRSISKKEKPIRKRSGLGNKRLKNSETDVSKKSNDENKAQNRRKDRCEKCKKEAFAAKHEKLCKKCDMIFNSVEDKCDLCRNASYALGNVDECSKCSPEDEEEEEVDPAGDTSEPEDGEISTIELLRLCKTDKFLKSNTEKCAKVSKKCSKRHFRVLHKSECGEDEGDAEWLRKKCQNERYLKINELVCKQFCKEDAFSVKNEELCQEFLSNDSEEEILEARDDFDRKAAHEENSEIDESDKNQERLDKLEKMKARLISIKTRCEKKRYLTKHEKLCNSIKEKLEKIESKSEARFAPAALKGGTSRQGQTKTPEKKDKKNLSGKCKQKKFKQKNKKICEDWESKKIKEKKKSTQTDKIETSKMDTQLKNEILVNVKRVKSEGKKDHHDEKFMEEKIPTNIAQKNHQTKHNAEKSNLEQAEKENLKQKVEDVKMDKTSALSKAEKKEKKNKDSKIVKNKCNKERYAKDHPAECSQINSERDIQTVYNIKCRKEKYRKKFPERCSDIESSKDEANLLERCQKPKYRAGHSDACSKILDLHENCKDSEYWVKNQNVCSVWDEVGKTHPEGYSVKRDSSDVVDNDLVLIKGKDPDWIKKKCVKKTFRNKHKKICKDICKEKKFAKKFKDLCTTSIDVDAPPLGDIDWTQTKDEDEDTIISEVINGIMDIVMKENEASTENKDFKNETNADDSKDTSTPSSIFQSSTTTTVSTISTTTIKTSTTTVSTSSTTTSTSTTISATTSVTSTTTSTTSTTTSTTSTTTSTTSTTASTTSTTTKATPKITTATTTTSTSTTSNVSKTSTSTTENISIASEITSETSSSSSAASALASQSSLETETPPITTPLTTPDA